MFHDILNWKKNQIVMNKTGMTDLQYEKSAKYKSLSKKIVFSETRYQSYYKHKQKKKQGSERKTKKRKKEK